MVQHVLVTGGAGFIGLQLARSLRSRGYAVTLLDNFSRGMQDAELQALQRAGVALIEYDLTMPLDSAIVGHNYTQVYHMAAVVGVQVSTERPDYVLRTNLLSTIHLLDWCARERIPQLCFASTSEVYAGAVDRGYAALPTPETAPLVIAAPELARSCYATSKIAGEILCRNYARSSGMVLRMVRYHNVYGPRMGYDHVIPQFIERVLARQNPFKIFGAYQRRAFCYIDDAVEATIRVMECADERPLVVNIGDDREVIQILSLAERLFAITGFEPQLDIHDPPVGSPEKRAPEISLLRTLTGYQPSVSLDEGLRRTYEWYRDHPRVDTRKP